VSGHVGDAVILFYPIPSPEETGPVCAAAIKAATDALEALEMLNAERPVAAPKLYAPIGLDIGEVVHGNIGSTGRFSFTIIGTPVNRAARLQALAKELGLSLLMTAEVADRLESIEKALTSASCVASIGLSRYLATHGRPPSGFWKIPKAIESGSR
jgi:class 3 adenylate cyclase